MFVSRKIENVVLFPGESERTPPPAWLAARLRSSWCLLNGPGTWVFSGGRALNWDANGRWGAEPEGGGELAWLSHVRFLLAFSRLLSPLQFPFFHHRRDAVIHICPLGFCLQVPAHLFVQISLHALTIGVQGTRLIIACASPEPLPVPTNISLG